MSDILDHLDNLEPAELRFARAGKNYLTREAGEGAVSSWKNANMKAARFDANGQYLGAASGAELDAQLVADCTFEVTDKGEKPVTVETVRGWPTRLVQGLYKWVRDNSGLAAEEPQEAMEKQFGDLALKLAGMASTPEEKRQWAEWMHGTVDDRLSRATLARGQEKNGRPHTPVTFVSALS